MEVNKNYRRRRPKYVQVTLPQATASKRPRPMIKPPCFICTSSGLIAHDSIGCESVSQHKTIHTKPPEIAYKYIILG